MTDLEITQLCARAAGLNQYEENGIPQNAGTQSIYIFDMEHDRGYSIYSPLNDKEQAMNLVIMLHMLIMPGTRTPEGRLPWHTEITDKFQAWENNLLRAICLCAAKVQQAKEQS